MRAGELSWAPETRVPGTRAPGTRASGRKSGSVNTPSISTSSRESSSTSFAPKDDTLLNKENTAKAVTYTSVIVHTRGDIQGSGSTTTPSSSSNTSESESISSSNSEGSTPLNTSLSRDKGITIADTDVLEEVVDMSNSQETPDLEPTRRTTKPFLMEADALTRVKDDTKLWAISVELLNFALIMGTVTNLRAVLLAGTSTSFYAVLLVFLVFALLCEIGAGLLALRIAYLKEKSLALPRFYFRIDTYFVALTFSVACFNTLIMGLGLQK